ncbi:uncharacterized protein PRCAT00001916001 [Priceomyces carsonii]|uniref:uncharacterized protein n=1 Tax=Priceomyces carsonii TaxID=28549 RepID=UPI002EDB5311|nr:unnamed protein product [Priceomyces carsonii]
MASEYIYDEEGETWPYFVLAVLTFILIPVTFKWIYNVFDHDDPRSVNLSIKGSILENSKTIGTENSAEVNKFQSGQKSARIFNKTLVFIITGWILVYYIGANFTKEANMQGIFDPYSILEISASATEREIKSRYRKLSLTFHPDKLPKDITDTVKEEMEAAFIRINLAYKALTDETTRDNFLKYGHPDGPQEIFHGIAIPKFLVEGKYSPVMIVVYFLLIGFFLPLIVGTWWKNVKSHTRKGLHVDTAALFTRKLADKNPAIVITPTYLLDWICSSNEIKSSFTHLSPSEVKEIILKYMHREFESISEAESLKIISMLPNLINGLIDIAVIFRHTDIVLAAFDLQKSVIQAVRPTGKYQELLQLPYVNSKTVESQEIKKLGKLMTLSEDEAKKILGIEDSQKVQKSLSVASRIPSLRIIKSEFKVPGEEVVPPSSSAHLVLQFLVKSPKLKSIPNVPEEELIEEETFDYLRNPLESNDKQPQLPYSYAPYFPKNIQNNWSGYFIAQKDGKLLEGSTTAKLENIDLSNIELDQESWKNGDAIVGSFKIPFPMTSPSSVGTYHYRVILKNNAYFGSDVDIPVSMVVERPPFKKPVKLERENDEDSDDSDISDPEEDTLAGALAALRGGNVKKSTKDGEYEEDYESDADNESIFTDINTDTEDESDEVKGK